MVAKKAKPRAVVEDKGPDPLLPLQEIIPELMASEHDLWLEFISGMTGLGFKRECEMHSNGNTKCQDRACLVLRSLRNYLNIHKSVSAWHRWHLRERRKLFKDSTTLGAMPYVALTAAGKPK